MTGAKAWRQKGTGRARVGALSVPQRTGGGVAFGPKPRALHGQGQPQGAAARAARGAVAARRARLARRASTLGLRRALHQAGRRGARRASTARAACSWCSPTARRPVPSPSATSPASTCCDADAVGVADVVGAARLVVSEAALEPPHREGARRAGARRPSVNAAPGDHPAGRLGEELRAAGGQQVHVPRRTTARTRRRSARRSRRSSACASRTCARSGSSPSRSAAASAPAAPALEEGGRDAPRRRTRSSCSRARSSEPDGHQEAQAHQPGPALRHLAPARGGHQDRAREVARPRASRSPAGATPTAASPRATAAAAPSASTARSTSSAARTACRPRSPRSSTTPTAAPTSRCSTTRTARSATSSRRRGCAWATRSRRARRADIAPGNACR